MAAQTKTGRIIVERHTTGTVTQVIVVDSQPGVEAVESAIQGRDRKVRAREGLPSKPNVIDRGRDRGARNRIDATGRSIRAVQGEDSHIGEHLGGGALVIGWGLGDDRACDSQTSQT